MEAKLSNSEIDKEVKKKLPDSHPEIYFAKKKDEYKYLTEEDKIKGNMFNNWSEINKLMSQLKLKIIIFHRHGMAIHNFLGRLDKARHLELVLNFLNSLNEEQTVNLCFHPTKLSQQDEKEFENFIL